MKATDLRKMNVADLNKELTELKEELFKLRFRHVTNQLDNPQLLKSVKRDIARVKTVLREKEMQNEVNA